MPAALGKAEVLALLKNTARQHGLHCHPIDHEGLRADLEEVRSQWFFGGRTFTYHLACRLDEERHAVRFREMTAETTWGIPLPLVTAETRRSSGRLSKGGESGTPVEAGPLDVLRIREDIEHTIRQAGWSFSYERGRP